MEITNFNYQILCLIGDKVKPSARHPEKLCARVILLNKLKTLDEDGLDPIESERFKDALVHFQQAISNSLPYI